MSHRFHIVDVFAEERYAGNPLAVVRDAADLDTATMQRIAREFGFSETTFVVSDPRASEPGVRVRIFTPADELPFAGHPTLGTAWVIREHLAARPAGRAPARARRGPRAGGFEPAVGGRARVAQRAARPTRRDARARAHRACARARRRGRRESTSRCSTCSPGIEFLHVPLASVAAVSKARLDPAAYAPLASAGFPTGVYWFARAERERVPRPHAVVRA